MGAAAMIEKSPNLIPHKLWLTAAHNWQMRCMEHDVMPPFDWKLEFDYEDNIQVIILSDSFKHTHRFTFNKETMHGLITGERDWTAELLTHRDQCSHDGGDASELYAALCYFYV